MENSINGLLTVIANDRHKKFPIDCEMSDVAASVNMAYSSRQITKEQADWLREYYGFGGFYNDIKD